MKRILGLFVAFFATISLFANMQGHFFMNVENENVQVANVESKFAQWLDLPTNTTFAKFRDETDNLGIRHLSYQQSVNGYEVANGIILVHAKNNVVFVVDGDIMDTTITAHLSSKRVTPLKAAQTVRKNASSSDAQLKIVRAHIDGKDVYRYAYDVMADDFSSKKYVDAETGQVIKDIPLKYNADVAGTVTTMYNGTQAITCYESEGAYYLIDAGRGIYTLDATNNSYKLNISQESTQEQITQELNNLINGCSLITNTSTTWSSSWNLQLKSITIDAVRQNNTWFTIGEGQADVYLKIKDKNNNLIYTSGYKDDPSLPTTFNITNDISYSSLPLSVEIWDYDPVGDDDFVDKFLVDALGGNMLSIPWQGDSSYSAGSYNAISFGVQPHFDAHWGMEKTLDFYQENFQRNSYDNEGARVYQIINVPRDEKFLADYPWNAGAIKLAPFPMVYGLGMVSTNSNLADRCVLPLVSIDVMAHEFTHLVTTKNGNGGLEYIGESGALNESFSDIIGIAVKKYATGQNDWLIGSDIMINVSNMRSMKDPNYSHDGIPGFLSSPQPDTYGSNLYWKNPNETTCETCDHGGVHTNSGVQNYWFYLLSEGGGGTNDIGNRYSVTGIGMDKAVQIAYRNLIYYLTPEATFEDARNGSIQAAIDLYGKDSQEHQSVANAWHAVGVGDKYKEPTNSITVKAKMPSNWGTTISAWIWADGSNGSWANLTKEGEWYSYTSITNPLNIIFVNGNTWNGDNNQTVDIRLTESACLQIGNNTSGKRSYNIIDCEEESERYVILAQRNTSSNWLYMTSDLGTASTKRYQAVDAGTNILANVSSTGLADKYYWEIEGNKLKTAAGYSTWTSGNSANLNATGKELAIQQQADGTYTFSFADGDNTRYLALNKTAGNDYFAYYNGTNQIYKLTLVKEGNSGIVTSTENAVMPTTQAQKIFRNGQLFILRDDKTYTVQGQEVR